MEGPEIDAAGWIAAGAAAVATIGTAITGLYLSRSNRSLLQAQAGKVDAEGEGTSVEAAVSLIKEMRIERQELREQLEGAKKRAATTSEEWDSLLKERRELQREIEVRDGHIRYLRRVLKDAGVDAPAEMPPA